MAREQKRGRKAKHVHLLVPYLSLLAFAFVIAMLIPFSKSSGMAATNPEVKRVSLSLPFFVPRTERGVLIAEDLLMLLALFGIVSVFSYYWLKNTVVEERAEKTRARPEPAKKNPCR